MIQRAEPGPSPAVSPPDARYTQRHCCKTGWYSSGAGLTALLALRKAWSCMIRRLGTGLLLAVLTPDARGTRRHYCPTEWCLWLGEALLHRARSCMIQ